MNGAVSALRKWIKTAIESCFIIPSSRRYFLLGGAIMHKFFAEHMVLTGAVLAFGTSMMRLAFVRRSFWSKLVESLICSSVTVGVFYGLAAIYPIDENVALAIGSAVGYLGTDKIKELIMQKIEGKNESDK